MNHEDHYSIWLADKALGWRECVDRIKTV